MPVEVILPKVDMDMESGQISRWYAKEGDLVNKGQLLFEIETDKAAMEVDAPSSGILRDVRAQEGTVVPVGQAVAWIYADGEAHDAVTAQPVISSTPIPDMPTEIAVPETAARSGGGNDDVRATPLARRLARETGVDLVSISGSGPKGRVQKKDVELKIGGLVPAAKSKTVPSFAEEGTLLNAAWLREGKDKTLPPFVLLHGFGSDMNSWRPMLAGGSIDNSILAIDLPGHGGSTLAIPGDLDAIAEQVERTIAGYHSGPVVLVGHSFGGAIAAGIAARGIMEARALVLFAPAGLGPEINGAFIAGFVRARSESSLTAWINQLVEDGSLLTKPFIAATLQQSQNELLRDAQRLVADRFFADGTQVFSIRQILGQLSMPVRVVAGTADRIIPASHASGLPGRIAVHVFGGTGHMPQLEQREAVMCILKDVSRSAR